MTRTTPELATPLQTSASHQQPSIPVDSKPYGLVGGSGLWEPHQLVDVWTITYDLTCNRSNRRRILVESGFEPGTLRPQRRDLTTRSPRPDVNEECKT
ncbi:hypothetical protein AVEN_243419-1 [Araneus ventricosus]|uniref:Uncharacterized protein n=1 Tax=Araneus ventricosus TaxID=182803 RepID=A0A4Y2NV23_ARAVE|nr:hypothetical protein AVEN_243419-1 [Araneus ventricosus]